MCNTERSGKMRMEGRSSALVNKMVLWSEKRHTVCSVDFHQRPCSPELCMGFRGPVSFFCSPSQLFQLNAAMPVHASNAGFEACLI